MAEENQSKYETSESSEVEIKDRGVFDFHGKKKEEEEKPQEEVIVTEFEKVKVSDESEKKEEEGEKKHSLLEKIEGDYKHEHEDTTVAVEKVEVDVDPAAHPVTEEKKGFLDKIKEKLPGHKKTEEVTTHPPPSASSEYGESTHEGEAKEKKGILEKIKEKLPGYHSKTEEDKENQSAAH